MHSTRRTIAYLLPVAILLQLVVMSYNHATGYVPITAFWSFLLRLVIATAFTMLMAAPMLLLDLRAIVLLDKGLPWESRYVPRFVLQALIAACIAIPIGMGGTALFHVVFGYRDGLWPNLVTNGLIAGAVNLGLMAGSEAMLAFRRIRESHLKAEALERENSRIRLETLKRQLNPHFLFNSLNVLSSLIKKDQARAQEFVDEFASVYRYTLDVIDRPAIELRSELDFARSYLYLQEIRFSGAVQVTIGVSADLLDYLVPPLALQVVLENAFKHNRASEESPLLIKICTEGARIVVTNNLQPRLQHTASPGVGLENLKKRYEYVSREMPRFMISGSEYVATLPLLPPQ
jgi:hypothetical protein